MPASHQIFSSNKKTRVRAGRKWRHIANAKVREMVKTVKKSRKRKPKSTRAFDSERKPTTLSTIGEILKSKGLDV
jgi:hypothetical protein